MPRKLTLEDKKNIVNICRELCEKLPKMDSDFNVTIIISDEDKDNSDNINEFEVDGKDLVALKLIFENGINGVV